MEGITLNTKEEVIEFLESLDGYGIIFEDEDLVAEFLKNHYGIE